MSPSLPQGLHLDWLHRLLSSLGTSGHGDAAEPTPGVAALRAVDAGTLNGERAPSKGWWQSPPDASAAAAPAAEALGDVDCDAAGYYAFLAAHAKSLEALVAQPNEYLVLRHLTKNSALVESAATVRRWLHMRHTERWRRGLATDQTLSNEATALFVLESAACAAARLQGLHPEQSRRACAREGVQELLDDLASTGGPVSLRTFIATRLVSWMAAVKGVNGEHPTAAAAERSAGSGVPSRRQLAAATCKLSLARRVGKELQVGRSDNVRLLREMGYLRLSPIAAGAFSTIYRCREIESGAEVLYA